MISNDCEPSFRRTRGWLGAWLGVLVACGGQAAGGEPSAPSAPAAAPTVSTARTHGRHRHGHHHRFEDAKSWAKVFDDPERDAWQKPAHVVELLALAPGMTVADVGAGTGYFEPHLSRAVGAQGKVLAVDIEPDMVRWIEARAQREGLANVEAVLGQAADPALPAGKVDRVLVVDTWHHIDDRVAYAGKLRAALAPGGRVVIVDFTKDAPHGPPPAARIPPEEVAAELTEAGLEARQVDEDLPHQYVVEGRRP